MSINRHHGGAIEDCARHLGGIADRAARDSTLEEVATRRSHEERSRRAHSDSVIASTPKTRARRVSSSLRASRRGRPMHIAAARAVEGAFADRQEPLPINVDGAIGAILADLGMDPATSTASS